LISLVFLQKMFDSPNSMLNCTILASIAIGTIMLIGIYVCESLGCLSMCPTKLTTIPLIILVFGTSCIWIAMIDNAHNFETAFDCTVAFISGLPMCIYAIWKSFLCFRHCQKCYPIIDTTFVTNKAT